jgi:DnaJ-class molecular chaperone
MSAQKHVIEVAPLVDGNRCESTVIRHFECLGCSGRGRRTVCGLIWQEDREVVCERCAGTGRLRARVTVDWEADI